MSANLSPAGMPRRGRDHGNTVERGEGRIVKRPEVVGSHRKLAGSKRRSNRRPRRPPGHEVHQQRDGVITRRQDCSSDEIAHARSIERCAVQQSHDQLKGRRRE
jgi:hypothetical protein